MKRRNFLKILPPLTAAPFVVNGFPMRPFSNSKLARILSTCDGVEDRVLVLIQLKGGNDGINTIIPIANYDAYANLRPEIKVPNSGADKFITLDSGLPGADQVGLHPTMTGMKALYDNGQFAVVQGVGYENLNQSHFKGTDLWLSGGDGTTDNFDIPSGWMGRALQAMYPDVLGLPTTDMPDPLGIQLGDSSPSLGFHTETEHQNVINLSGQDAAGFYSLIQTIGGAPILNVPDSEYGDELSFIMGIEQSINMYAQRITDTFNAGTNSISTYPDKSLANQLKTIARLVSGGCKTKIYLCSVGGFDTHGTQIAAEGLTLEGTHPALLQDLSDAVKFFFDDLEGLGIADQVVACTFSEFGRCAKQNGSLGTDHGTLAPMLLFGKNIKAGVLGTNVDLDNLSDDNQVQGTQFDYRQVFATLLQDWLGATNEVLTETMFDGYTKLALVDDAAVVSPDCYFGTTSVLGPDHQQYPMRVFPNPAIHHAEVAYKGETSFPARLTLHSLGGSLLSASNVQVAAGENLFYLNVAPLPGGTYFVRLENRLNGKAEVVKLKVAR